MKLTTIVALTSVLGLFIVGVASATTGSPAAAHPAPAAARQVVTPSVAPEVPSSEGQVTVLPEETIVGHVKARVPRARASKTWTCGAWQGSSLGGEYRACEWK